MLTKIKENLVRIVILDISGIYAQIHNQEYFDRNSIKSIQNQYSNRGLGVFLHWIKYTQIH